MTTAPDRARKSAAWRVAYMATELSTVLGTMRLRTQLLEERIAAAAVSGVPRAEVEAMTGDALDGIDVAGMIERAYGPPEDLFEVNGRDTVMYCLAHRRRVRWLPAPAWWIHDDGLPGGGNLTDPRGCMPMWWASAPIEITRKTTE